MVYWILAILVVGIVVTIVVAVVARPAGGRAAERRRRYAIEASGPRIPLAPEREAEVRGGMENGTAIFEPPAARPEMRNRLTDQARDSAPEPEPARSGGRGAGIGKIVDTPDGEMVLTTPPFELRAQVFSKRVGKYFNGLTRRLPVWVVACPRMRMESLVTPTPPDGRDPDDWAHWRRRVRLRAIDIVLCDRRTWKPILAIMLEPSSGKRFARRTGSNGTTTALVLGGGQDRMIDEVLAHVGIPLIRGSGHLTEDWALIEPYVNEAILPTMGDDAYHEATSAGIERPTPDAAVRLLMMDEERGGLLG